MNFLATLDKLRTLENLMRQAFSPISSKITDPLIIQKKQSALDQKKLEAQRIKAELLESYESDSEAFPLIKCAVHDIETRHNPKDDAQADLIFPTHRQAQAYGDHYDEVRYQALLALCQLAYQTERNGSPEDHALKLTVMFDSVHEALDYLKHYMAQPNHAQSLHDACLFRLPDPSCDIIYWKKQAKKNILNKKFRDLLAVASDIEALVEENVLPEPKYPPGVEVGEIRAFTQAIDREIKSLQGTLKAKKSQLKQIKDKKGKDENHQACAELQKRIMDLREQKYNVAPKYDPHLVKHKLSDFNVINKNYKEEKRHQDTTGMTPQDKLSVKQKLKELKKDVLDKRCEIFLLSAGQPLNKLSVDHLYAADAYRKRQQHDPATQYLSDQSISESKITAFHMMVRKDNDEKIPPIKIKGKAFGHPGTYLMKVPVLDRLQAARAACLGKLTGCCQSLDDAGHECVKHGLTREEGGFYVVCKGEPDNPMIEDKVIGQCWAWRSVDDAIVFDSIESSKVNDAALMRHFNELAWRLIQEGHTDKVSCGRHSGISENFGKLIHGYPVEKLDDYSGYRDSDSQKVIYDKKAPYLFFDTFEPARSNIQLWLKSLKTNQVNENILKTINYGILENHDALIKYISDVGNKIGKKKQTSELISKVKKFVNGEYLYSEIINDPLLSNLYKLYFKNDQAEGPETLEDIVQKFEYEFKEEVSNIGAISLYTIENLPKTEDERLLNPKAYKNIMLAKKKHMISYLLSTADPLEKNDTVIKMINHFILQDDQVLIDYILEVANKIGKKELISELISKHKKFVNGDCAFAEIIEDADLSHLVKLYFQGNQTEKDQTVEGVNSAFEFEFKRKSETPTSPNLYTIENLTKTDEERFLNPEAYKNKMLAKKKYMINVLLSTADPLEKNETVIKMINHFILQDNKVLLDYILKAANKIDKKKQISDLISKIKKFVSGDCAFTEIREDADLSHVVKLYFQGDQTEKAQTIEDINSAFEFEFKNKSETPFSTNLYTIENLPKTEEDRFLAPKVYENKMLAKKKYMISYLLSTAGPLQKNQTVIKMINYYVLENDDFMIHCILDEANKIGKKEQMSDLVLLVKKFVNGEYSYDQIEDELLLKNLSKLYFSNDISEIVKESSEVVSQYEYKYQYQSKTSELPNICAIENLPKTQEERFLGHYVFRENMLIKKKYIISYLLSKDVPLVENDDVIEMLNYGLMENHEALLSCILDEANKIGKMEELASLTTMIKRFLNTDYSYDEIRNDPVIRKLLQLYYSNIETETGESPEALVEHILDGSLENPLSSLYKMESQRNALQHGYRKAEDHNKKMLLMTMRQKYVISFMLSTPEVLGENNDVVEMLNYCILEGNEELMQSILDEANKIGKKEEITGLVTRIKKFVNHEYSYEEICDSSLFNKILKLYFPAEHKKPTDTAAAIIGHFVEEYIEPWLPNIDNMASLPKTKHERLLSRKAYDNSISTKRIYAIRHLLSTPGKLRENAILTKIINYYVLENNQYRLDLIVKEAGKLGREFELNEIVSEIKGFINNDISYAEISENSSLNYLLKVYFEPNQEALSHESVPGSEDVVEQYMLASAKEIFKLEGDRFKYMSKRGKQAAFNAIQQQYAKFLLDKHPEKLRTLLEDERYKDHNLASFAVKEKHSKLLEFLFEKYPQLLYDSISPGGDTNHNIVTYMLNCGVQPSAHKEFHNAIMKPIKKYPDAFEAVLDKGLYEGMNALEYLLTKEHQSNSLSHKRAYTYFQAIIKHNPNILNHEITKGPYKGHNVLSLALMQGKKTWLDKLLSKKDSALDAYLSLDKQDGHNVLTRAIEQDHLKLVEYLVNKKPELLDYVMSEGQYEGRNVYSFAMAVNNHSAAEILLTQKPEFKEHHSNSKNPEEALVTSFEHGDFDLIQSIIRDHPELLETHFSEGKYKGHTPFTLAVLTKRTGVFEDLVKSNPNPLDNTVSQGDYCGLNPLHIAILKESPIPPRTYDSIIESMLNDYPDMVKSVISEGKYKGLNALTLSVISGKTVIFKSILKKAPELARQHVPFGDHKGKNLLELPIPNRAKRPLSRLIKAALSEAEPKVKSQQFLTFASPRSQVDPLRKQDGPSSEKSLPPNESRRNKPD